MTMGSPASAVVGSSNKAMYLSMLISLRGGSLALRRTPLVTAVRISQALQFLWQSYFQYKVFVSPQFAGICRQTVPTDDLAILNPRQPARRLLKRFLFDHETADLKTRPRGS